MIVTAGTRVVYRKRGYAANFCIVCRAFRPCQFSSFGVVTHVQGVSVGRHNHHFYVGRCTQCSTSLAYDDAEQTFPLREDNPSDPTDVSVCRQTPQQISERLAVERRAQSLSGGEAERRLLMLESLHKLAYAWFHEVERGRGARVSIVGMVPSAVPMVIAALMYVVAPPVQTVAWWVSLIAIASVGVIGLIGFVWYGLTRKSRVLRLFILPRLAASIRPLHPSDAELDVALQEASNPRNRWTIARHTSVAQISSAMREGEPFGAPRGARKL